MNSKLSRSGLGGTKSHQLFLLLKEAIVSGRIAAGDKLPGEVALAKEHGISRVTVRRAMEALATEDLVVRLAGKGTIVNEQPVGATIMTASVANLMPNMVKMSKDSNVQLLEFSYVQPPDNVRNKLGLGASDRTQRSVRVRSIDGKPFSYLVTHVPEPIALHYNEGDLATTPLFVLLERSGILVDQAKQEISATLATSDVARALQVPVGSPLISLNRIVFDRNQRGVEYLAALYRPDRYRIEIDLNRAGSEDSRYWQTIDGKSE